MMTAIELISDMILPVKKTDRVSLALRIMEENRVGHLPVTENNKYLGLISENELLAAEDENHTLDRYCNALPKPFVSEQDHIYQVLHVMCEQKLTILPILDENQHYLGNIAGDLLLEQIANILSVHNPGGIIVLDINQNDYSLSEIARIVESNDTKILSTSVKTFPESTRLEVTLKLNRINVEPVIQTFIRFDYDIHTYYGKNEKDEDLLRERYNSLMSFLKF